MERFLQPDILGVMIPILGIVVGGAVLLGRSWTRHRERMAMIEMGLHPDHPPAAGELAESTDAESERPLPLPDRPPRD